MTLGRPRTRPLATDEETDRLARLWACAVAYDRRHGGTERRDALGEVAKKAYSVRHSAYHKLRREDKERPVKAGLRSGTQGSGW
jgi:hypothetical protein